MTENTKKFIESYKKHGGWVYKPDVDKMAAELNMTPRSVYTLVSLYRRKGLIKDEVKR